MLERMRRGAPVADVVYLGGGAALLGSAFVQWVSRGEGSGLRGHALVDAVVALGRHVPALSIGRLTILWYLVPALGAASWIVCGLGGPRSGASRALAGAALVMTALTAATFVRLVGLSGLGWGPKLSLLGAAALCVSAWAPQRSASRRDVRPGGRSAGAVRRRSATPEPRVRR
jgi:hypothetical protein